MGLCRGRASSNAACLQDLFLFFFLFFKCVVGSGAGEAIVTLGLRNLGTYCQDRSTQGLLALFPHAEEIPSSPMVYSGDGLRAICSGVLLELWCQPTPVGGEDGG